jgi:DnaK suppressor protein
MAEDPTELSDEQVEELAADLRALEVELREALELSRDGVKPVDLDEPIGRVSRIDAIQQQKMAQNNRRGHEARLRMVSIALAAIDAGDYGLCRECEEPIAFRRLKARPESGYCLACQSSRESR